ncbi:unnamed protein product, partial [Cladocopium goreaui]
AWHFLNLMEQVKLSEGQYWPPREFHLGLGSRLVDYCPIPPRDVAKLKQRKSNGPSSIAQESRFVEVTVQGFRWFAIATIQTRRGDAAASCEQHPTRGKQGRAASWTWRLQKACEVLTLSDIEQTLNVTEVHYCSWLEDVAFQRKSAEYLWMLVCSAGFGLTNEIEKMVTFQPKDAGAGNGVPGVAAMVAEALRRGRRWFLAVEAILGIPGGERCPCSLRQKPLPCGLLRYSKSLLRRIVGNLVLMRLVTCFFYLGTFSLPYCWKLGLGALMGCWGIGHDAGLIAVLCSLAYWCLAFSQSHGAGETKQLDPRPASSSFLPSEGQYWPPREFHLGLGSRTLIRTPVQSERRHLESLQRHFSLIPRRGDRPRFQVVRHDRHDSDPPRSVLPDSGSPEGKTEHETHCQGDNVMQRRHANSIQQEENRVGLLYGHGGCKACEVLTLSDLEQTLNVTEVHYCSWLEDVAFQRKSAEYLWMLVCSTGAVHKMRFLSTWLLFLLRQHADQLLGLVVGHTYFFFEELVANRVIPTVRFVKPPKRAFAFSGRQD